MIPEFQDLYEESVKVWVLEEIAEDTDSHEKSSHAVAAFGEGMIGDMDDTVKDRAAADPDHESFDNSVYSWNAVLIPVDVKLIMSADYTPRRRWYNADGDYIENPAKYFLEAKQAGLERQKAIGELLKSIEAVQGKETLRPDLLLKRLTPES